MIEWSEQHKQIRSMVRRFVEAEIVPQIDALEHGDTPPYEVLRKMLKTFGIGDMAKGKFLADLERKKKGEVREKKEREGFHGPSADAMAMQLIPIIELCRHSPGMVTALGVSIGLTAGAIERKGTLAQQEEFVPPLLTLEKVGAWAITEPGSGSDAFGSMRASARRDGDDYILNGSKTFITNGPFADTIVFICRLEGAAGPDGELPIVSFILDRGMKGLEQSKPLRKMGMHSSPTGQLFLDDVRVPKSRLLGESEEGGARKSAKDTFGSERTGVAAMALGIIERCLELCKRVRQDARAVRQGHRRVPAHPAEARQDGGGPHERAEPGVPADRAGRQREAHGPRRGVGRQALQRSERDGGLPRGGAALRGQRLHGRVPRGAALPGRQSAPDLWRNGRDPDLADRAHVAA
jgi:alkylation response protein AidB-like acyl-CoA dehydrogenase